MTRKSAVWSCDKLSDLATYFRKNLESKSLVLLYAFNCTGKTRLSMAFKDEGKKINQGKPDTLYYNAFTEDLFSWDNDLENDTQRVLKINPSSRFFEGIDAIDADITEYLSRYTDVRFYFKYEGHEVKKPSFARFYHALEPDVDIKISRGEEGIFIWCVFMAICEKVLDGDESYQWVKYIYVDDPISSLDDNNAIAVTCDLANLIKRAIDRPSEPIKVIVSSHHSLFFNVMYNEISRTKGSIKHECYFLNRLNHENQYTLRSVQGKPFFHHVASLVELQKAAQLEGGLYTFHFNALRTIMEKTSAFFGKNDISFCLEALSSEQNRALFNRALNLLSHGGYSLFEPAPMGQDNQKLFRNILDAFIARFGFDLPDLSADTPESSKDKETIND